MYEREGQIPSSADSVYVEIHIKLSDSLDSYMPGSTGQLIFDYSIAPSLYPIMVPYTLKRPLAESFVAYVGLIPRVPTPWVMG